MREKIFIVIPVFNEEEILYESITILNEFIKSTLVNYDGWVLI